MTASVTTGPAVTIIIACRNEEANVERCVREVAAVLPGAEILVVDGGTDRTFDIVSGLARELPGVRVVRNEGDLGKGHAIKRGLREARAPVMAQFDCDLQFFAGDLPALLAPILAGQAGLVVGSRFLAASDRSSYAALFFRDAGNRVMAWYISCLVGRKVTDVTTGMKAWSREAMDRIRFRDNCYSYEAEILVRAACEGIVAVEIPVRYASRTAGASMHRSSLAVIRAGLVIMAKSFAARFLKG